LLAAVLLSFVFAAAGFGQALPDTIRDYKVYKHPVIINIVDTGDAAQEKADADVTIGDVALVGTSITGLVFDFLPTIRCPEQSGRLDFVTFHDFRLNGVPVTIEDYDYAFVIKKGEKKRLPRPISVFVPSQRVLEAAWKEFSSPSKEWTVTGRMFVFGHFKKFGFYFKRVVPIDISVTIKNPLPSR